LQKNPILEAKGSQGIRAGTNPRNKGRNMNILIVDDDTEIADLLESSVSLWGYSAGKANNGMEALKMLQQSPYDVVITDAQMPGMTGFELCKQICFRYPSMYIIGITGCLEVQKFQEAGADIYFRKPFPLEKLQAALEHISPAFPAGN